MAGFLKYWHTIKHLKPIQIIERIRFRLVVPQIKLGQAPAFHLPDIEKWVSPISKKRTMLGPESFLFLNQVHELSEHGWDDPRIMKLWRYNLHYFDDLNAKDSNLRYSWHESLIHRWIDENPVGIGTGWEPYPTSLRIVNWIKWIISYGIPASECIQSLALQLRWLRKRIEYYLLGNHLLANAKALIFGGLFFKGNEAKSWLETGLRILNHELTEQILPDGGHFELSPMYHLIVLEDLLDLVNILKAYSYPVPDGWLDLIYKLVHWGSVMCHPDGDIPFFNDAAFNVAPTIRKLICYSNRLNLNISNHVHENCWLKDSGYIRFAKKNCVLFFDVAPVGPDYLPGHAHADTLSIEFSLFGKRVLVNTGTSIYSSGLDRQYQRSTNAHNTVMIDELDSSEVWGGFRVARRAKILNLICNLDQSIASAEHDGYKRLIGKPRHWRKVELHDGLLKISDRIQGKGTHKIQCAWHLHPQIKIKPLKSKNCKAFQLDIPLEGKKCEVKIVTHPSSQIKIENYNWHPEFGMSEPAKRLVVKYEGRLPTTITSNFYW